MYKLMEVYTYYSPKNNGQQICCYILSKRAFTFEEFEKLNDVFKNWETETIKPEDYIEIGPQLNSSWTKDNFLVKYGLPVERIENTVIYFNNKNPTFNKTKQQIYNSENPFYLRLKLSSNSY